MASDTCAFKHVLPVVGQTHIDEGDEQSAPYASLGPSSEPDADQIPLVVTLVHVAPRPVIPRGMQLAN